MDHADAFDRLKGLDGATRKLFDDYSKMEPGLSVSQLHKILLALELRWKIEEAVLIPSLSGTQGLMDGCSEDAACELTALRSLTCLALSKDLGTGPQRVLLYALEVLASLRAERVNCALTRAQRAAVVDPEALGRDMDRLLNGWRGEFEGVELRDALLN